jgi:hypothetical protein
MIKSSSEVGLAIRHIVARPLAQSWFKDTAVVPFQIDGSATSTSNCGTRYAILPRTDAASDSWQGRGGEVRRRSNNVQYYYIESSCIRTVSMGLMS